MTLIEQIITIGVCVFGTVVTRFLPFIIFSENRKTPPFIQYMGRYLPAAVFGMLVVYCLKDVDFMQGFHGIPELIGIILTVFLHKWKHQMLVSIAGGTIGYMLLIHFIFVDY